MGEARKQRIYETVHALFEPGNLLRCPRLSFLLATYHAIPMDELLWHSSFVRLHPSAMEIEKALAGSKQFAVFTPPNNPRQFVIPGYPFNPQVLLIRDARRLGTIDMFGDLITSLMGTNEFSLYAVGDGRDFAVMVPVVANLFGLWRSLKYVPFQGEFLQVEMYSPALMRLKPPAPANDGQGQFLQHVSKYEQHRAITQKGQQKGSTTKRRGQSPRATRAKGNSRNLR